MRIYLIGFMGSGKSTLGKQLARATGLNFIDLDKYIEERNCRTVPQLFEQEGEKAFRVTERKALTEVSEFDNVVVATGGGAPCFFDNMELMNRTGVTLYLDLEPSELARRLSVSKTIRPLISGKSQQELVGYITQTLLKRRPFYEKAKIKITGPQPDLSSVLKLLSEII